MRIAVQTYTMREQMQADFWGTLRKIAAMGYAGVELTDVRGIMHAEDLLPLERGYWIGRLSWRQPSLRVSGG